MHAYYREVTHDDVEVIQAFSKAQKKYYYYVGINKYGIKCKLSPWYDTRRKAVDAMFNKRYQKFVFVVSYGKTGMIMSAKAANEIPEDYKGVVYRECDSYEKT